MSGLRYNKDKIKWGLVHYPSLVPMVEVLMFGAKKYSAWNWTKGLSYVEISESLMRHLTAFMQGEDDDPESKLSHVGHIMCNAMFLSFMFLFRKDMDDRVVINTEKKVDKLSKKVDYSLLTISPYTRAKSSLLVSNDYKNLTPEEIDAYNSSKEPTHILSIHNVIPKSTLERHLRPLS